MLTADPVAVQALFKGAAEQNYFVNKKSGLPLTGRAIRSAKKRALAIGAAHLAALGNNFELKLNYYDSPYNELIDHWNAHRDDPRFAGILDMDEHLAQRLARQKGVGSARAAQLEKNGLVLMSAEKVKQLTKLAEMVKEIGLEVAEESNPKKRAREEQPATPVTVIDVRSEDDDEDTRPAKQHSADGSGEGKSPFFKVSMGDYVQGIAARRDKTFSTLVAHVDDALTKGMLEEDYNLVVPLPLPADIKPATKEAFFERLRETYRNQVWYQDAANGTWTRLPAEVRKVPDAYAYQLRMGQ